MKLIMQNSCPRDLPGCEYTVVDIDPDLLGLITARGEAFRRMQAEDPLLRELLYRDWRPSCFSTFDGLDAAVPPETGMPFAGWIGDSGWVLAAALDIPGTVLVPTDCRAMAVSAEGGGTEVGWIFNLKDGPEVISTAVVSLRGLTARPGIPPVRRFRSRSRSTRRSTPA